MDSSKSFPIGNLNAAANRAKIIVVGLRTPRSMPLKYAGAIYAFSASFSCVQRFLRRSSRTRLDKTLIAFISALTSDTFWRY
ncbi:MAG: hypothetical protein WCT03_09505 [Candidatus Obscuribacterales bacterium]